jgi:hypothetical protein
MPAPDAWRLLVAFLLGFLRRKRRKDPACGRVHQGFEIACDRLRLARIPLQVHLGEQRARRGRLVGMFEDVLLGTHCTRLVPMSVSALCCSPFDGRPTSESERAPYDVEGSPAPPQNGQLRSTKSHTS